MLDLLSATTATTSVAKFTITTSTEEIRVAATGSGPSGVAIATLVIAGLAVFGTIVNVVVTAWLGRRDELKRWRRDALCAAVVAMLTASRAHLQAVRDEADDETEHRTLDELALHAAQIELFVSGPIIDEVACLMADHIAIVHGIGAPTGFSDILYREQALIIAAKQELGIPLTASAPTPPSPQSAPTGQKTAT